MNRKQQIINKLNEGQEPDAHKYTWKTIPLSLKKFWMNYFDQKKICKFANNLNSIQ